MKTQEGILIDALAEIREIAEQREDIAHETGPDGQPRPDAWMRVATIAREALRKAGEE